MGKLGAHRAMVRSCRTGAGGSLPPSRRNVFRRQCPRDRRRLHRSLDREETMTQSHHVEAVIIGAGVIGAATAFELAKRGYRTLSIDKLPAAGYGPTSNSCSIVRAHYSSWDGVAMAYEGFSYWDDWPDYLEVQDDAGTAKYVKCGTLLLKSDHGHHEKVLPHYDTIGIPYEEWSHEEVRERAPFLDLHAYWPPSRPDEDSFWEEREKELDGAIYTSGSGYVND